MTRVPTPSAAASIVVDAFWRGRAGPPPARLADALIDLWTEATAAWPELSIEPSTFMEFVAARVPKDADAIEALASLRPGDLLLCHACLMGEPTALTAFDAGYLAPASAVVRRMALRAEQADDVRQGLAERLLVGTGRGGPKLAAYAGRGDLRNWVRTAALRIAQSLVATEARRPTSGDDALARAVEPDADPSLGWLRRHYGEQFREAFESAVRELGAKERTVLRMAFVDGMTSDALGAIYGVHRSTAARWVASARDRLSARTRRTMMERLSVGRGDLQSIMRLIQSQLDVSVRRCLAEDE